MIYDLLSKLAGRGVKLTLEGRDLGLDAPKGALTNDLVKEIRECKDALVEYLLGKRQREGAIFKHAEKKEYYPLSSAQRRMFFLNQVASENLSYNMINLIPVMDATEIETLENALRRIIERHESLRTSFQLVNGEPFQFIHENVNFSIKRIAVPNDSLENAIKTLITHTDLSCAPLIKAFYIQHAGGTVLLIDVHHIITDGVSQDIIVREISSLYNNTALQVPRFQYKDYASYQSSIPHKRNLQVQEAYWLKEYSTPPSLLNLPTDFARPASKRYTGKSVRFFINAAETEKLRSLADEEGVTMFMLQLSVFSVLLSMLSRQEEIILGVPFAGRQRPEFNTLIGIFINTLPVRSYVSGKLTFRDFLQVTKNKSLEVLENQDYQFDDLVQKLNLERDLSRNPIYDVILEFFDKRDGMAGVGSPVETIQSTPEHTRGYGQFDISLNINDCGGFLSFDLDYDTDLFKSITIDRFITYFRRLTQEVCLDRNRKIEDFSILTNDERDQLLNIFNNTDAFYPSEKTIIDLFDEQVNRTPDNIALRWEGEGACTYRQLKEKSEKIACYLQQHESIKKGDLVAVMLEREAYLLPVIFGILRAGGAYVPIDPHYPAARQKKIIEDSAVKAIITRGRYYTGHEYSCVDLDDVSQVIDRYPISALEPVERNALAYVLYTSGSTGKPKGVMVEHHAVINRILWMQKKYPLGEQDVILQKTPITFDVSVWELFWWSFTGASLALLKPGGEKDPEEIIAHIQNYRVSTLHFVPSMLNLFLTGLDSERDFSRLESLRMVFCSGEALKPEHVNAFRRLLHSHNTTRLVNLYGPTEATVDVSYYECMFDDATDSMVPIGKPIDNIRLYILNENKHLSPIGVPGELCIAGVGLARGYLRNPVLTSEKFIENPVVPGERIYRTGDLTRWLSDGNIEFLGRIDNQVKIRGIRVELGEIENQLLAYDGVREAVVIANERDGEKYLVAYYTAGETVVPENLRDFLFKRLPEFMVPSYFVMLERMPLTPSGKLNTKALPAPTMSVVQDYEAPANDIEQKLVDIWAAVLMLDKEKISVRTAYSFFELGGHSLRAIILVSKIYQAFQVKVPLKMILQRQTLRGLAEFLQQSMRTRYSSLVSAEKREYYTLSSAQKRLYFLNRMNQESTSYNTSLVLPLQRDLDVSKLETTFQKIVQRHESFRTNFRTVDNEVVQYVREDVHFKIEHFQATEEMLEDTVRRCIRPFNLANDTLIRAGLIDVSSGDYVLVVDMHHIISDGTTMIIVQRDFLAALNDEVLLPLKYQYKDFSQWQNNLIRRGYIAKQERYWTELLGGDLPRLDLQTDRKRPAVFTFQGDHITFTLDASQASAIRAIGVQENASLFMNMLAMLNVLFYKYTGQEDIIIGSGIAGRPHADLQDIAGMFVNTLAMRSYPDSGKRYNDFLKEVAENCLLAFENQDLQFEELIEKLNVERDSSRNPLFDVCLVVQNFRDNKVTETATDGSVSSARSLYQNVTTKFDMTFFVYEAGDEIIVDVEYYKDIFNRDTIERLITHFKNVVNAVIRRPDVSLGDIDILSGVEKQQILVDFNNTATAYPIENTIHAIFEVHVAGQPEALAVLFDQQRISYHELNKKANQLAHHLVEECCVNTGDRIGVYLDRSPNTIIAILAILKAGGVYVPIDIALPEERVLIMINDSGLTTLISEKKFVRELNRLQWRSENFSRYICLDSLDVKHVHEKASNVLMDERLWDYVGATATDEITGGGWTSSYTGLPLSKLEMDEYGDNVLKKITQLTTKDSNVLEIGCASGISMYRIAPKVRSYYGTDLSKVIIEKNSERVAAEGHTNIKLKHCAAHEIDQLDEAEFDLIIINSVIQAFHGHNYLYQVLEKCIGLLKNKGHLFIGDVMDEAMRIDLVTSLENFKRSNVNVSYVTKTDLSSELFVSKNYFRDLQVDFPTITSVTFSSKIHTVENELTRYRYDAILAIDKTTADANPNQKKVKYQYGVETLQDRPIDNSNRPVKPDDLAYVIYTSGTTGAPKGVMIEHRSVLNLTYGQSDLLRLKPELRSLQFASPGFDASCYEIFNTLLTGGTLVLPRKEDLLSIAGFESLLTQHNVELAVLPPSYLHLAKEKLGPLCTIVSAGEAMIVDDANDIQARGIRLVNAYGPTENTVATTLTDSPVFDNGNVTIGKPLPNVQVYICDKDNNLCPVGVAGEMCIGGASLARGYLGREKLTAEKFVWRHYDQATPRRLYRTGDLAKWLPDGNIEFLGRIDQQIKIRGCRIELGEIEAQLNAYHGITESRVVFDKRNDGAQNIVAYYTSSVELDAADIKIFLAAQLPEYMVPAYYMRLETIPMTLNGKLDRKSLPDPVASSVLEGYIAPSNEMEKALVSIWSDVLGIDHNLISIDKSFFELGGNSLKIIQLNSHLHERMKWDISIPELFQYATILSLVAFVKDGRADPEKETATAQNEVFEMESLFESISKN